MKQIIKIDEKRLADALALVKRVFDEFEAPEFPQAGVQAFYAYCGYEKCLKQLQANEMHIWTWQRDEEIYGVLALIGDHVGMLFVDKNMHNQGIATKLLKEAQKQVKQDGYDEITINAFPYAVEIYHHMGFVDTDRESIKDGMRFTPMKRAV